MQASVPTASGYFPRAGTGAGSTNGSPFGGVTIRATAARMIAPAPIVLTPIDSFSTAQPRKTATSGLTYA